MSARTIARIVGVAVAMTWTLLSAFIDTRYASAGPCPDVEVVFARGTNEPPGVGGVGQAFVDSLRSQIPGRSVGVYAVNYPATDDFVRSSLAGAGDAGAHVQSMVANCPNTRMVLGGYSQGAGVIDMTTDELAPQVANHVAAVAVFGNPESTFARTLGAAGSLRSARFTAPRRLTCAFPTIQSAPKAGARPHTFYMFSPG